MKVKDYIASGIIELYVMEALSETESREVEAMAMQHPEVQAEIEKVRLALNNYASLHAKDPKPSLKDKIFQDLPTPKPSPKVSKSIPIWTLGLALVVSLIALAVCFYHYQKLQEKETQLEQIIALNNDLRQNLDQTNNNLELLTSPGTAQIELLGIQEKAPDSKVLIYWNQAKASTFLVIEDLPTAPSGQQYQLWSLVDGIPQSAGLLDGNAFQLMANVDEADQFAITLEPEGGSTLPTLTELYVIGSVL